VLKPGAGRSQGIDIGCLEVVRTEATHVPDPQIIGENEDDVRSLCLDLLGGGTR